ncbi:MAG: hypothetical protein SCJ94_03560, partial [Bacillota bacterium]|nr:hypothetical protein [Bacillota bacterium]
PYVLEVKELWPDAPVKRGKLSLSWLKKAAKRLELKAYSKAAYIIAGNQEIADLIKERSEERNKIMVAQGEPDQTKLLEIYDLVLGKKL